MKQYFSNLSQQERKLVLLAGSLLTILILGTMWASFVQSIGRLEETVAELRKTSQWMQQAKHEITQMRGSVASGGAKTSLLVLVDSSARQSGLNNAVKRVEPEGNDKVRIQLEQAGFDDIAEWLEKLYRVNSVRVNSVSVDKQQGSGMVNARLTLEWI